MNKKLDDFTDYLLAKYNFSDLQIASSVLPLDLGKIIVGVKYKTKVMCYSVDDFENDQAVLDKIEKDLLCYK